MIGAGPQTALKDIPFSELYMPVQMRGYCSLRPKQRFSQSAVVEWKWHVPVYQTSGARRVRLASCRERHRVVDSNSGAIVDIIGEVYLIKYVVLNGMSLDRPHKLWRSLASLGSISRPNSTSFSPRNPTQRHFYLLHGSQQHPRGQ